MKHIAYTLLMILVSLSCFAQSYKKLMKTADKYYKDGFYTEAVNTYLQAAEEAPEDLELDYRIGQAYLKSKYKDRALPYLKKVYENTSDHKDQLLYNLALAYQYNHLFMEALDHFSAYREVTSNTFAADQHIMQCAIGIEYINNPKDVKISNVREINSDNQDYAPLVTADGNALIFTSRRAGSTGEEMAYDNNYYEDIYIARKKENQWSAPEKITGAVNTNYHECGAAISPDGTQLFIYMDEGDGDFYVSTYDGKIWGEPKPVGGVNSPYRELSISMNGEGNKLYFSSNRPGGYGGFDIYVSTLDDYERWGKPINLGPKINTSGDEDAPFIHADGETLYFSSTGHLGMGGFDIFKSKYLREKWTTPINLAYPINTAQDDNYFVIAKNNEYGYYATAREDGLGGNDVYAILMDKRDFIQEKKDAPLMTLTKKKDKETFLVGKISDLNSGISLEAEIILSDNEKNIVMTRTFSDPETGTFRVSIPEGTNLGLTVERDGYLFYSQNLKSSELKPFQDNRIVITLQESKVGTIGILKNIFFDTNKSNIRKESLVELNQIYALLKAQPNIVIQINGHTDNVGDDAYNQDLSERRARAVADYLLNFGLSSDRITAKGFGESKPIASNDYEEGGRSQNRRTEIEIIKILEKPTAP
ncbi:OmpA family protein [Catalinimonas niigatensis]|uniref:OmpA family protein n=1 Tax=Catalinimonas niigatensis TaxID=1397264 RepID=UPI002666D2CE|nr:OmpA family protein [Catalinimonas niigatensis]WPP51570.1 OmpA family protein [Catalinimonas niigatensis]